MHIYIYHIYIDILNRIPHGWIPCDLPGPFSSKASCDAGCRDCCLEICHVASGGCFFLVQQTPGRYKKGPPSYKVVVTPASPI